jgi:ABC-2 type transport system permease protein
MKLLSETGLFWKRKIMEIIRQPVWIVSELMTPLLYMLLFSPLLKNITHPPRDTAEVLNSFVPGILTLLAFSTGMGSGWAIIWELQSGVIERLRVTPASRFAILMGTVLADILNFLAPSVLVIAISSFFGFIVNPPGLVVLLSLLCLLTTVMSAWSTSMGLILKQSGSLAAVLTSIQLPLTLLSGVLIPLSLGPGWLRAVAHLNPLYYTVEASRVLATGVLFSAETLTAFAVMIPLTALTLWWATEVYRKTVA